MSSTCTSPPLTRTLLPLCIQMFDAYVTKWSVVFIITLLSQQQTAASLLSGLPLEAFVDFFLFFFFIFFGWKRFIRTVFRERESLSLPCSAALLYCLSVPAVLLTGIVALLSYSKPPGSSESSAASGFTWTCFSTFTSTRHTNICFLHEARNITMKTWLHFLHDCFYFFYDFIIFLFSALLPVCPSIK